MTRMTKEEAIEIIEFKLGRGKEAERFGLRNEGVSSWIGKVPEEREALEMAISALSTNGEYIKKEDAQKVFEKSLLGKYILWDTQEVIKKDMKERISQLPTYSIPDSAEIKEIKEPTLLESFKDSTGKVSEIWAVKGKLQIRTRGIIHNCNGIFGNNISVKSVNGSISVFPDPVENKGGLISRSEVESVLHNNLHALINDDQLYQLYKDIGRLHTYSFPDSAENKGE